MQQDKGSRILDAAEALLLRLGYRKVAMAEVASRAGVGKGTAYLYWPSKAELFGAVLVRDSVRQLDELLAVLRADPAECRLHRMWRTLFRDVLRNPLAKAVYTRDYDVLGELLTSQVGVSLLAGKADTTTRYLALLHRHGLLTDDPATDDTLVYRISAAMAGAFLFEGAIGATEFDVDAKADALAITMRRAFEPADEPAWEAVRAAAAELIELYQGWRNELAGSLLGGGKKSD